MKRCTKWQRIAGTTKMHIVTWAVRVVVEGRLHHFVHGEIAGHSIQWIPSECHILGNPTCSPKDANITSPHYHLLFKRLQKKCTLSIHLILSISLRFPTNDANNYLETWNMEQQKIHQNPKKQLQAHTLPCWKSIGPSYHVPISLVSPQVHRLQQKIYKAFAIHRLKKCEVAMCCTLWWYHCINRDHLVEIAQNIAAKTVSVSRLSGKMYKGSIAEQQETRQIFKVSVLYNRPVGYLSPSDLLRLHVRHPRETRNHKLATSRGRLWSRRKNKAKQRSLEVQQFVY